MRGREPSREEAKPSRPKSRPGPVPTLGQLAAMTSWVWVYCEARGCHHQAPLKLADAVAQFGEEASSDRLRRGAMCTKCGARGATIRLPSWVDASTGYAQFPSTQSR